MNDKITAIIQARMGSSRLPGKVLLPILDKPMIWHIVNRLKTVKSIHEVIIATSDKPTDIPIAEFGNSYGVKVFRGNELDVLDRFYQAASALQSEYLIRITADCPLVDPDIVKQLIELFRSGNYDYCAVATGAGVAKEKGIAKYPDGLDVEIFSYKLLQTAWNETTKNVHREHVTSYMWQHPERFKIAQLRSEIDYSNIRLTVDNDADYQLIKWIYENLFQTNPLFGLSDIIQLLNLHQGKQSINSVFIGKEGYEKLWE